MKNTLFDYVGVGVNWVVYAVNENEALQTTLFILSMITTVIVFLKTVIPLISKFASWLKTSLSDGKLTEEEMKEGQKIVDEIIDATDKARKDIEK